MRAVEEGFNAVRFDFRGNGESDGEFIEQTLSSRIEDLKAVIEHFSPEKYVLFGSSFGGKVVLHASLELEPNAVIGRAPVTYGEIMEEYRSRVEDEGKFRHHPGATIDERFFEDFDTYSFSEVTGNLDAPVAIFQGSQDRKVRAKTALKAARELETDVMLQKFQGENHSFSEEAERRMQRQMFDWLESQK